MQIGALLATLALAACATSPQHWNWSQLEGCWIDASDAIPPASMVWRADPDHPGALIGTWAVTYTDEAEDADIVTFTLAPIAGGMRLCERDPSVAETCAPAVLAGQRANDGDAIFNITADTLEFGYSGRPAPFYIGRRGGCAQPAAQL